MEALDPKEQHHSHQQHPDVHAPWQQWSEGQTLHVAAAYSNPFRWTKRRELANDFRRHMDQTPNVRLHMGELAYGDRPHEVTTPANRSDVQLRTSHELFHKENILNRAIQTFPKDWKYGAYVDADFAFTRHDWALEAIHQLQHYDFVQLFSSYTDLSGEIYGIGHQPLFVAAGFVYRYIQNGYRLPAEFRGGKEPGQPKHRHHHPKHNHGADGDNGKGHCCCPPVPTQPISGAWPGIGAVGGAWAFRRSAFDTVGGLLDKCILGSGDWFMAFGLVGETAPAYRLNGCTDDYRNTIIEWQRNAARLKKNVGYIDCHVLHHFHGSKSRRAYGSRDSILLQHQFSPSRDLKPDWQGIYQLNPDSPELRDSIREYFRSRFEDDPNLYGREKSMV